MEPRVSILIPVYNSACYIGEAIESVFAQTYQDFEVIVVDDGSTDKSGDVVRSYERVRYFRKDHAGISSARNYALAQARGELIAFIDADDLWEPEKLQMQTDYLRKQPECRIVFCRYRNFTGLSEEQLTEQQRELLKIEVPQYLAGACIRRDLFEEFGNFSEMRQYGEDTEWIARLKIARVDVTHRLEKVLYRRRIHTDNITLTHEDLTRKEFYGVMADAIRSKWKREET